MPAQPVLDRKFAKLASEFGLSWANKLFGEEAVASLPVLKAGPNKGQPKGYVHWRRAVTSGWSREVNSVVAAGQIVDAWIGLGALSNRSDAVSGTWLGRQQQLAGHRHYLFAEGRARHAAEVARRERDSLLEMAEMAEERAVAYRAEGDVANAEKFEAKLQEYRTRLAARA